MRELNDHRAPLAVSNHHSPAEGGLADCFRLARRALTRDTLPRPSVPSPTFVAIWGGPLHILVNNAGVLLTEKRLTPEGVELQFATNHLGHFALALDLHDALAAARGARIVSLSSEAHPRAPLDFDDLNLASRPYDPMLAYGQSTTANALFAVEAARRWADDGITANAVHPGAVISRARRGGFGVAPYALDSDNARRLWELSLDLTGA